MNATIRTIAETHLQLDTLETRHTDSLDFHNLSVWQIRDALQAAHDAGADVKKARKAGQHNLSDDELSISMIDMELLKAVAQGKIDLNEMVKNELAKRGLDHDGRWIGYGK